MSEYTAMHRFGLGPQHETIKRISIFPQGWLTDQLNVKDAAILPGKFRTSHDLAKEIAGIKKSSKTKRNAIKKSMKKTYFNEMEERFTHALTTETPYVERLVHFWSNHFTVSFKGKPYLAGIVGCFEREAIRPHVLGKFSDMARAVYEHPAMLVYLDNVGSFGPNSKVGKRRNKGLNENLAREILELHTLGVNGGYTQNDVIALAKIITGWTVVPPRFGGGGFKYYDIVHEPGAHKLLSKTYAQNGQKQGIAAINDLTRHPSTANFVATKLVRHFVSDNPPRSAIKKIETVFKKTDGDLKAIAKALIKLEEAWKSPLSKVKTPYEMIVSSLRLGREASKNMNGSDFKKVLASLSLMGHAPFQAPSPAGWPDMAEDWVSPNMTLNRVEWCHALANVVKPKFSPLQLAKMSFGEVANPETLLWIDRAPSGVDGMALFLASPEWQRR